MKFSSVIAFTALALSAAALAQSSPADHAAHHPAGASPTAAPTPMADGEVRKVDKEQGKVTLKHGPIASIDMPPMTMVFKVAEPKMLDALKQGDKVKFAAEKVNGALTVTAIEVAK
jgi:Cu/Ag efflux protein CusF